MNAEATLGRRAPGPRRTAVLAAAESLFISNGVDATSIDAIARAANVAKGTVYLYFPSKDDIVRELERGFNARIVHRTHKAAASSRGSDAVEEWCAALVDAYLDELSVHDMLFYGRGSSRREDGADNALIDDLTALLAARGDDDAESRAAFLVGGITLLVDRSLLASNEPERSGLRAFVRQATRMASHSEASGAQDRAAGRG
jgi:AcrR family transcriptional regulator